MNPYAGTPEPGMGSYKFCTCVRPLQSFIVKTTAFGLVPYVECLGLSDLRYYLRILTGLAGTWNELTEW